MNGYASEYNPGGLTSNSGPTLRMFGPQGFIGGTNTMGQPMSGEQYVQNEFLQTNATADAAVRQKMANAIDPATGHLIKNPQTQGEWAEVERQAQQLASDTARSTFAQESKMLGFNPNMSGTGLQGGPGGAGSPGGGSGGTANGMPLGPDPQLMQKFKTGITNAIDNPGMSQGQEQQLVGQNAQGLGVARDQSIRNMQQAANASGFQPSGGSQQQGMNAISQQYAGKIADSNTSTHLQADEQRRKERMQALGLDNTYLESQARLAQERTNSQIALMQHNQPAIPNVTGGGYQNSPHLMFPGANNVVKGGGGSPMAFANNNNGGGGAGFNWNDPNNGPQAPQNPGPMNPFSAEAGNGQNGSSPLNGYNPSQPPAQPAAATASSSMQRPAAGNPMAAFGVKTGNASAMPSSAGGGLAAYSPNQRARVRSALMPV